MRRTVRILPTSLGVSILAGVLILNAGTAATGAAGRGNAAFTTPHHHAIWPATVAGVQPARPAGAQPLAGTHYVYVDDGLAANNTIDAYKISPDVNKLGSDGLTHIGDYPTGGGQSPPAGFGSNDIATTPPVTGTQVGAAAGARCLVHADTGTASVESFSVALTGALTRVSSVKVGAGQGDHPDDVHVSAGGKFVYVAAWNPGGTGPSDIAVVPLQSGCALGKVADNVFAGRQYFTIALIGLTRIVAFDELNSRIDVYSVSGTKLTLLTSTPSQIAHPEGGTVAGIGATEYTLNGQNISTAPRFEAHTITITTGALGSVKGSPATDPRGLNGANVYWSSANGLATVTEQSSNSLGSYSLAGGALKLVNNVAEDSTSSGPLAQVALGGTLYVVNYLSQTVTACPLSAKGLGACALAATLSSHGTSAIPGGIGVL